MVVVGFIFSGISQTIVGPAVVLAFFRGYSRRGTQRSEVTSREITLEKNAGKQPPTSQSARNNPPSKGGCFKGAYFDAMEYFLLVLLWISFLTFFGAIVAERRDSHNNP